jgi:peptidoglycan hydrolase-like protein with peptidoglycan-binding domain
LQSAAIKVADPNDPGRGGDHITLAIEVGEHAEPVGEMKRIYYTTGRRLGYRTFSRVEGPDVIELKRMLHALGYWRPELTTFRATPAVNALRNEELRKTDPAAFDRAQMEARRLSADYQREFGQYDAEAVAAVDKFRQDKELAYPGNPPGLVDESLIAALTAEFYRQKKRARP